MRERLLSTGQASASGMWLRRCASGPSGRVRPDWRCRRSWYHMTVQRFVSPSCCLAMSAAQLLAWQGLAASVVAQAPGSAGLGFGVLLCAIAAHNQDELPPMSALSHVPCSFASGQQEADGSCPLEKAGLWSKLTFNYVTPLILAGYKKPLQVFVFHSEPCHVLLKGGICRLSLHCFHA